MEKIKTYLPLPLELGRLFLIEDDLSKYKEELEIFLDGLEHMMNKDFSKKVFLGREIKSNNSIEGYKDDISFIKNIIEYTPNSKLSDEEISRIMNMYQGYNYILNNKEINKDNLKHLYSLLSKDLLSQEDLSHMGKYYRDDPVYIFFSSVVTVEPDHGVDKSNLEEYMNYLLNYLNEDNKDYSMTDYFIKSQIAHYYFVYLHPYFDINGRTARTTSMWYLLNHECFPYIIFNRAIQLDKHKYCTVIRDVRRFRNVTYFLNYMLRNVLLELEKEHTIEIISDISNYNLNDIETESLYYILSMKSILTYYDYIAFYNRLNNKRSKDIIIKEMLEPLIDKGIIIPGRTTTNGDNHTFTLNEHVLDINEKNKHLNLVNKITQI